MTARGAAAAATVAIAIACRGAGPATPGTETPSPTVAGPDAVAEADVPATPGTDGDADDEAGSAGGPEAVVTQVPEIPPGPCPTETPWACEVTMAPIDESRVVEFEGDGVAIRIGFGRFMAMASERNEQRLIESVARLQQDENPLALDAERLGQEWNRAVFVVAALLDAGSASVFEDGSRNPAATIVRETWDWVGCGGGCRQSGRQYRLRVPGEIFFSTTDLFEDSF